MKATAELQKISDVIPEFKPDEDVRGVHTESPKVNHREDQAASQGVPKVKFISTGTDMIRGCVPDRRVVRQGRFRGTGRVKAATNSTKS